MRHAQIPEGGEVEMKLLARHHGRAHRLAVEPGSPHTFYTCGEDGLVQHVSEISHLLSFIVYPSVFFQSLADRPQLGKPLAINFFFSFWWTGNKTKHTTGERGWRFYKFDVL